MKDRFTVAAVCDPDPARRAARGRAHRRADVVTFDELLGARRHRHRRPVHAAVAAPRAGIAALGRGQARRVREAARRVAGRRRRARRGRGRSRRAAHADLPVPVRQRPAEGEGARRRRASPAGRTRRRSRSRGGGGPTTTRCRGGAAGRPSSAACCSARPSTPSTCSPTSPGRRPGCSAAPTTRVNDIEVEDCAAASLELADGSLATVSRHARLAAGDHPPPLPLRGASRPRAARRAYDVVGRPVGHHARRRRGGGRHRRASSTAGSTGPEELVGPVRALRRRARRRHRPAGHARRRPGLARADHRAVRVGPHRRGRRAAPRRRPPALRRMAAVTELWTYNADHRKRPNVHPLATPVGRRAHPRRAARTTRGTTALWFTIKFVNDENFWEEYDAYGVLRHVDPDAPSTGSAPTARPSCIVDERSLDARRPRRRRRLRHRLVDHPRAAGRRRARPHRRSRPGAATAASPCAGAATGPTPACCSTTASSTSGCSACRRRGATCRGTVDGGDGRRAAPRPPGQPPPPGALVRVDTAATYGDEGWSNFLNAAFLWDGRWRWRPASRSPFRYRVVVHDGVVGRPSAARPSGTRWTAA